MAKQTIKGRIIRITDNRTIIVNLGKNDGITTDNIFRIMAEPEPIIDPDTGEVLGSVEVVKAKLKASLVNDKFTIATTNWVDFNIALGAFWNNPSSIVTGVQHKEVDEGELEVNRFDIEPWQATKDRTPVRVGDFVTTEVEIKDKGGKPPV